ncbi:MspA protein, partial [Mycolicibacterium phlei RIVM601174]
MLMALVLSIAGAAASLFVSSGTSHAGLDNELSLVDGQGRTLTIQQWDTFLNGVFPLDRNRLTREWFHSGRAKYIVAGEGAEDFEGTLELGYQIGFPWSLGVGINFSYTTPNILLDDVSLFPAFNPLGSVITPNLFPGVSISADLGNGPGIQ